MKSLVALCLMFTSVSLMASNVGVSTHPMVTSDQAITTEFNTFHSYGEGFGITGRYFRRINPDLTIDAGVGLATDDRPSSIYAAVDYQLFPDYDTQPRVSLKSGLESVEIEDDRWNIIGTTPIVSKSVVVNGQEFFPFVATPIRLGLNSETQKYRFFPEVNFGTTTGGFRIGDYDNLIGNVELGFDLSNGGSTISAGLTYPIL